MNKFRLAAVFLLLACATARSQQILGTTGLLNTPSAEMQPDGTFMAGGNFLHDALTPQPFDYNTGNYYLSLTFLPFLEVSYRMTLYRDLPDLKIRRQDRSFAARIRLLREKNGWPSIVIGENDLLTTAPAGRNKHLRATYLVATRQLTAGTSHLNISLGYAPDFTKNKHFSGFFGGLAFSPPFPLPLRLLADYDTRAVNLGFDTQLWKYVQFFGLVHNFRYLSAGLAFRLTYRQ